MRDFRRPADGSGFSQAAKAGISFGKDDLIIPVEKQDLIHRPQAEVKEFEQRYQDGLIPAGERYNKVVDAWSCCSDEVAGGMLKEIRKQEVGVPTNSVWMMSNSGARGSCAQMRQLAGLRGLMAKPSGEVIEPPINFKEGRRVSNLFSLTAGARKGGSTGHHDGRNPWSFAPEPACFSSCCGAGLPVKAHGFAHEAGQV